MMKSLSLFIGLASALAAQTIREARLDPKQAVDLPVSREVTTVMFPGPITAVAGADMLIEGGKQSVEVEEGTPLRFHVSHAPGSNFILVRSLQPDAAARLTAIYDGSAYVLNLRTVAADSTASVIFQPAAQGAAVRVETPPEPVKFSPRRGGRATLTLARAGSEIEIAVADNGPGIAPAHRGVVFERFRQLGDALGDKPQGAGLGLAISQRIIERHGGRIWIDDAEEGGARFRISLRAADAGVA